MQKQLQQQPLTFDCLSVLRNHRDSVLCVSLSSDGRRMASGCADGAVIIWQLCEAVSGSNINGSSNGHSSSYRSASAVDDSAWTLTPAVLHTLLAHTSGVMCVLWSSDDRFLLTCGTEPDDQVIVWDTQVREMQCALQQLLLL